MNVDFLQIGIIFGIWIVITGILLIFAKESKKGTRMLIVYLVMSLILLVLWYLSFNNTIPLCTLIKCG